MSDEKSNSSENGGVANTTRDLVELKKWNAVTVWSWDCESETCAICRNMIVEACIDCQANRIGPTIDCTICWGHCNHAFHFHCISRWLKTRSVCPLDNEPWGFQKYSSTSTVTSSASASVAASANT